MMVRWASKLPNGIFDSQLDVIRANGADICSLDRVKLHACNECYYRNGPSAPDGVTDPESDGCGKCVGQLIS